MIPRIPPRNSMGMDPTGWKPIPRTTGWKPIPLAVLVVLALSFECSIGLGQSEDSVERAARSFRIQAYDSFRNRRPTYQRYRRAGDQVLASWQAAGKPDARREDVVQWFENWTRWATRGEISPLPLPLPIDAGPDVSKNEEAPPISVDVPRPSQKSSAVDSSSAAQTAPQLELLPSTPRPLPDLSFPTPSPIDVPAPRIAPNDTLLRQFGKALYWGLEQKEAEDARSGP